MLNAKLVGMFSLSHKVSCYIPATININTEIDNTPYVNHMAEIMSNAFGGATATKASGYWMSDTCGLVKENTTIIFSFAETLDNLDPVIDYLVQLKTELNQDAMAIEVDGKMWFIK